jgi:hypothetical protein
VTKRAVTLEPGDVPLDDRENLVFMGTSVAAGAAHAVVVATDAPHAAPLLELSTILLGSNNAHLVPADQTWSVIGAPNEGALLAADRPLLPVTSALLAARNPSNPVRKFS